jgi:hypothetical protein
MGERLQNTELHKYEINRNMYVYEEVEMGGARNTLGLNDKLRQNFNRNAWRIFKHKFLKCDLN